MRKGYGDQYYIQKWTAGKRGIEWQFTYDTWLSWWGDDIVNRGRKKGQLVMARIGDVGPYHPDNVYKSLMEDNIKVANTGKKQTLTHSLNKGKARKEAWHRWRIAQNDQ
jgi:hypothetical protein